MANDVLSNVGITALPSSAGGSQQAAQDAAALINLINTTGANQAPATLTDKPYEVFITTDGRSYNGQINAPQSLAPDSDIVIIVEADASNTAPIDIPLFQSAFYDAKKCASACPGAGSSTDTFKVYLETEDECGEQLYNAFKQEICSSPHLLGGALVEQLSTGTLDLSKTIVHVRDTATSRSERRLRMNRSINEMAQNQNALRLVFSDTEARWDNKSSLVLKGVKPGYKYQFTFTVLAARA